MFEGTLTAIITPFNERGVDYESFERLIESQISGDINGLVFIGTTGEPSTMTSKEKQELRAFALKSVKGRVPVIFGTGCNCTQTAVENSITAQDEGADGILVVSPYYNKCTQQGLILHYKEIAKYCKLPMIIYNVPGRTGVNILPETVGELAQSVPSIVGIKEACGNLEQIAKTAQAIKGSKLQLMSGDDKLAVDIAKLGGTTLISVASNALPKEFTQIMSYARAGKFDEAAKLYSKYDKFVDLLFSEVNPIPIKYACSLLGLCKDVLRLPLTSMSKDKAKLLKEEMQRLDII
ncbi:MAG: 4-hydroxy-tetrahydrodipicolinate synthase [Clostridia bacterium]|nr:4-hydroxy-tetrahydrodipicolinate synthase [Clostridia bacterium]MDE7329368.1 4-hydroxy-tetrahydrodipicolinate synthase [Clostridia bacterium]